MLLAKSVPSAISAMHTFAPSAAKLSARALPMPEAPPVMNIILSLNASQNISIEKQDIDFDSEKIEGLQMGTFKLKEGEYKITVASIN